MSQRRALKRIRKPSPHNQILSALLDIATELRALRAHLGSTQPAVSIVGTELQAITRRAFMGPMLAETFRKTPLLFEKWLKKRRLGLSGGGKIVMPISTRPGLHRLVTRRRQRRTR